MADFGATELDAFRTEAREWLEANFPKSLTEDPDAPVVIIPGAASESPDAKLWLQRMGAKGWGVPTWPEAWFGKGLSPAAAAGVRSAYAESGVLPPPTGRS